MDKKNKKHSNKKISNSNSGKKRAGNQKSSVQKLSNQPGNKMLSAAGSVSGLASILGSWQICHNVCLGIVALLSIVGITIAGMPLFFLTKFALPFWSLAAALFAITLFFYITKRCISPKLLLLNAGLIIAGIPFQSLQKLSPLFWSIGGALVLVSVFLFVKDKIKRRNKEKQEQKRE